MEKCTWASGKENINVKVEEFTIKISPIILNTVMTIMAALSPKTKDDESKDTSKEMENLWGSNLLVIITLGFLELIWQQK